MVKKVVLIGIRVYQKVFSLDTGILPWLGLVKTKSCIFYPTCSEYMYQAITKYGIWKGSKLGLRRLSKCHPWAKPTIDPLL